MAVYTALSKQDIEALLRQYDVGSLLDFQEISSGIENTNYFITTGPAHSGAEALMAHQRWVLTIFENLKREELPYFCDLTRHLEQDGFKVPAPLLNSFGESIFSYKGKSGVIVPCLTGEPLEQPDNKACARVGAYLARMHLSLRAFSQSRPIPRNIGWVADQINKLSGRIDPQEFEILNGYYKRYCVYQPHLFECPQGTVHGDLFKDNVLFENEEVSGVFDFYHACDATFIFDLAVAANDWTTSIDGKHDKARLESLCEGYRSERSWTDKEHIMWPYCLELAALRFWISRLVSLYVPSYQQGSLAGDPFKNPTEMKSILLGLAAWDEEVIIK